VRIIQKYLWLISGLMMWVSCEESETLSVQSDEEFFPLMVGFYQIYQVEETIYSELNEPVENVYGLKVMVVDSFQNLSGSITYVIHRSTLQTGQDTYEYFDTWAARKESDQVVVDEGNTSFIKLAYPLVIGKQWNGNALNDLGGEQSCGENPSTACDIYRVESVGPVSINGLSFNDTLEVLLNNNADPIVKQDIRKEIYARNVGLVYKETSILEYCTVGSCIGQQQIDKGIESKLTLVEYGNE